MLNSLKLNKSKEFKLNVLKEWESDVIKNVGMERLETVKQSMQYYFTVYGPMTRQNVTDISAGRKEFGISHGLWSRWYNIFCTFDQAKMKLNQRVFYFCDEKEKNSFKMNLTSLIEAASQRYLDSKKRELQISESKITDILEKNDFEIMYKVGDPLATKEHLQQIEKSVESVLDEPSLENIGIAVQTAHLDTEHVAKLIKKKRHNRGRALRNWSKVKRHIETLTLDKEKNMTEQNKFIRYKLKRISDIKRQTKGEIMLKKKYIREILKSKCKEQIDFFFNKYFSDEAILYDYLYHVEDDFKCAKIDAMKIRYCEERTARNSSTAKEVSGKLETLLTKTFGLKNVCLILALIRGDMKEFKIILKEDKELQTQKQISLMCSIYQAYKMFNTVRDFKRKIVEDMEKEMNMKVTTPIDFIRGEIGSLTLTTNLIARHRQTSAEDEKIINLIHENFLL